MNTSLYILAEAYRQAADTLSDLDLDAQTITDTLEALGGEFSVKAQNMAMCLRNLEATAQQIRDAEAKIAKCRQALENRVKHLKQYLLYRLTLANVRTLEGPYLRLSIRKNPASVEVYDASRIPEAFMRRPGPPLPVPGQARH